MVISLRQNRNPIYLKFNSENLNQVDNHKHLGVTISSNCKWAEHINNILERNHAGHHCIKRQILILWKLNLLQILSVLPLCRRDRFPGHYQDQVIYVSTVSSELPTCARLRQGSTPSAAIHDPQ